MWVTANWRTFAFYGLPTRFWEFGLGGLAAMIPRGTLTLSSRWWRILGWCGIVAILASGYVVSVDSGFPGWVALVPVLGAAAVLVACAELPDRGVGVVLGCTPLQILGTLSYCWYLWHWPFLVFSAALFPNIAVAGKAVAAIAALGVAAMTQRLVESPIRFHPYLVKRPALSLQLAGVVILVSFGGACLSVRFADQLMTEPGMKRIAEAVNDIADMPTKECVSPGASSDVKTCVFGDTSAATHLVLFGDSHALQWFNPVQRMAASHRWKLTTVLKLGCPAADITVKHWGTQFATSCDLWRAGAIRRIVSMRPSIVVIGNAITYVAPQGKPASRSDVSLSEWRDGMKRTLEALTSAGLQVAAVRDTPLASFDVPTCLARSLRHPSYPGAPCAVDRSIAVNPAVFAAERAAASGLQNVRFVDLTDQLCERDVCRAVHGAAIMYRNNGHLTGAFADSLMPVLEAELLPILRERPMSVADMPHDVAYVLGGRQVRSAAR